MSTTESNAAITPTGGALRAVLLWTPAIVLGLLFVLQGVFKLMPGSPWPAMFEAWGYPNNVYLLVGVVELLAGIALFVPRVAGYAAFTLAVVMVGASLTHVVHGEWFNATFTAVLAGVLSALGRARM